SSCVNCITVKRLSASGIRTVGSTFSLFRISPRTHNGGRSWPPLLSRSSQIPHYEVAAPAVRKRGLMGNSAKIYQRSSTVLFFRGAATFGGPCRKVQQVKRDEHALTPAE